jgi:ribosomal protein L32E
MKFLRTNTRDILRLGKRRKKDQKWRNPRGRDSKIREKRRGHPKKVEIGYGSKKEDRNKINSKKIIFIKNILDAKKADSKNEIAIINKVGAKKRKEIEEILKQNKVEILNKKNETR